MFVRTGGGKTGNKVQDSRLLKDCKKKHKYFEAGQGICNLYMGLGARQRVQVYI